jgi:hypothetical protein
LAEHEHAPPISWAFAYGWECEFTTCKRPGSRGEAGFSIPPKGIRLVNNMPVIVAMAIIANEQAIILSVGTP